MFSPYQMGSSHFPAPPPFAHPYSPMINQLPQQTAAMGGRGLFGRLLQGFGGASKLGGLSSAPMQPMNLMSIIQNTQKVINIVQNVTPMVQQYGPLLRNLPTIYKMLKEAPSVETTTNGTNETETNELENIIDNIETELQIVENETTVAENKETKSPILVTETTQETKTTPKMIGNIPAPKMYV